MQDAYRSGASSPTNSEGSKIRHRIVWTKELITRFEMAALQLGVRSATPTTILMTMDVDGLTREHVASRLQKMRAALCRQFNLSGTKELDDEHGRRWAAQERPQLLSAQAMASRATKKPAPVPSSTRPLYLKGIDGVITAVVRDPDRGCTFPERLL
ncbi:Myb-like DNA-binding domain [Carpediemonas membranifera]|uniref:Myb-like DNA-binding domain n=1 Tax=Carpediemonas membranifera TaxID=201153 RepID=A0A8J6B0A8_9EUKA|nr:Myb-like DNA-binding domain [Carpediemonas membranifera]|eukprot:KAG9396560.1 Myb-like DNA-binding domain [Carpediemonas membranifera]